MVAGNIPGLTQTASLAIYDAIVQGNDAARAGRLTSVDLRRLDRGAPGRPAHHARPEALAVSEPSSDVLDVRLDAPGPCRIDHRRRPAARPRDRRRVRAVGGGQDDVAPADRRPDAARLPATSGSASETLFDSSRSDRSSAARSADRDDLPGRPALPAPERRRQHPVRSQGVAPREADARLAEVAALCGVERLDGSVAGDALGRRAAACRPGTGTGTPAPAACSATSRSPPSTWPTAMRSSGGSARSSARLAIPVLYVTHSVAEAVALGSRLFLLERGQDRRRRSAAGRPRRRRDERMTARSPSKACSMSSPPASRATPPIRTPADSASTTAPS